MDNAPLSHAIAATLESDILAGRIAPYEKLAETPLAERFRASRTPVREALTELVKKGLAERKPRVGVVVAGITLPELFEAYELLAELHGVVASMAARRINAAQRKRLSQLLRAMATRLGPGERDSYIRLDGEFEECLLAAAHNMELARHVRDCSSKIGPLRIASISRSERLNRIHEEHKAIVQAVVDGRADEARSLAFAHVSLGLQQASDLVALWKARYQV